MLPLLVNASYNNWRLVRKGLLVNPKVIVRVSSNQSVTSEVSFILLLLVLLYNYLTCTSLFSCRRWMLKGEYVW